MESLGLANSLEDNKGVRQVGYQITAAERADGTIAPEKLAAIVRDIETIGFAVVEDIVTVESCDMLVDSVLEDVEKVRALGKPTRHEENTGPGHLQLGLRRYAPYVRPDLVTNPLIECVVADVLGDGAWLGFYNGNVNCVGSGYQPLHFDRPYSWKSPEDAARDGQPWPPPSTTLSCSIAFDEITIANGATEIYPKSQFETEVVTWATTRIKDRPDLLEKWGPPSRMTIPARSVCFRDPRMWHRGVPNTGTRARAMIAATYHAARCKNWRGRYIQDLDPALSARLEADPALRVMDDGQLGDGRMVFQSDVREVFDAPSLHGVNRNVRFVEEPERVNHFLDSHQLGGARIVRGAISPVDA